MSLKFPNLKLNGNWVTLKGVASVYLDFQSSVDDNDHEKQSSLEVYVSQVGRACIPCLIPGLVVLIHCYTVCVCVCVCDWTHSLFSLPLCTWIGQYVEDRGEEGQPLSTSDGSWENVLRSGSLFYTAAVEVKPDWSFLGVLLQKNLLLNYNNMPQRPSRQRAMSQ